MKRDWIPIEFSYDKGLIGLSPDFGKKRGKILLDPPRIDINFLLKKPVE